MQNTSDGIWQYYKMVLSGKTIGIPIMQGPSNSLFRTNAT